MASEHLDKMLPAWSTNHGKIGEATLHMALCFLLISVVQETTRNKHMPTKRDPRGCLFGHTRKWDFRVDPRPSSACLVKAKSITIVGLLDQSSLLFFGAW